jgi:hypothetical protein
MMNSASAELRKNSVKNAVAALLLILVCIIASIILVTYINAGIDYNKHFYPAGRALLNGQSPYTSVDGFYNPPWLLVFLTPLAIFDQPISLIIYLSFAIAGITITFLKFKPPPISLLLLFCSAFIPSLIFYANIDWLVWLGLVLPIHWGIWFIALKPQLGGILILLWLYRLRNQRRRLFVTFTPLIVVLLAAYFIGWYQVPESTQLSEWSASIWPWGIPVGLFLAWIAFRRDDETVALAAMPFLSPYLSFFSWSVALFPFINKPKYLAIVSLLSWFAVYFWRTNMSW